MHELLRELCLLDGVSGNEGAVREAVARLIDGCADCTVDPLGSLIVKKKGRARPDQRLMICAHMDEVGFLITGANDEGYLAFAPVGGIDPRVVFGCAVRVGAKAVPGVIGAKALHHQTGDELGSAPAFKEMVIDIGAATKEEALSLVQPGDTAAFLSGYVPFGDGRVKAKAIDDRAGCALMIDLIRRDLPYDVTFVFNVQEEVGLRGAAASAYTVNPDIAFVLEATTAADLSGVSGEKRVCLLEQGPVISFMDLRTVYEKKLYQAAFDTAREQNIPCQTKTAVAGGNDAGAIHLARGGIRTLGISLPCRYLHSASCVIAQRDYENTQALLQAMIGKINDL